MRNSRFGQINDDQKMLPDYNYLINGLLRTVFPYGSNVFKYNPSIYILILKLVLFVLLGVVWLSFSKFWVKNDEMCEWIVDKSCGNLKF